MSRRIEDAARDLCLAFPETEEILSHGSPTFKAKGKSFAIFTVNHHGDGRVGYYLNSPPGAQQLYTENEPDIYFVPPYVGPKGWLGVELNKGLEWDTVARLVHDAWANTVPAAIAARLEQTPGVEPPNVTMTAEDINPYLRSRAQDILSQLAAICDALPETNRSENFGDPVWKAGKKTFVWAHHNGDRMALQFWVGVEQQSLLTMDPRYKIPAYTGQNGWIQLDVEEHIDWAEIDSLLMGSYRHFALKRMLKALGE